MNKKIVICGLIFSILLSGCVYYPQMTDVPLISHKNDLKVDAGVSLVPSANATVSYGLTNKLAIQSFGSIGGDNKYLQCALGYYKNTSADKIIEVYGGGGLGYGDAFKSSTGGGLYGNYYVGYAQVNYGKTNNRFAHMDYGIGLKTGMLHSNLTNSYYYFPPEVHSTYIDNSLLIEPIAFIRMGGERLKLSLKLGGCWIYKFTHTDKSLPYSMVNFGLGINYSLK